MNQAKRYQVNPVVSCGDESDGAVLFHPDADETIIVNLTGRTLWHFLEAPHTVAEMGQHLKAFYPDVAVDQAADDARQFVEDLLPDFLLEAGDHD